MAGTEDKTAADELKKNETEDKPTTAEELKKNETRDKPTTADELKGHVDKKAFVGGLAYDVTDEDLKSHFSQYGEVVQATVKYDRITTNSRGFAFVDFATKESWKLAIASREQVIKGKKVEVKPAQLRENKKVFVGGLAADYPEDDLKKHFEQFGAVEAVEWPYDRVTKARRNFAFVVFEEEEASDKAAAEIKQTFGSRECDVKKAVPQGQRWLQGIGGGTRGVRTGFAGRGFTGNFQMGGGMPYQGAGWNGDWYNPAAANFYNQNGYGNVGYGGQSGSSSYGSYNQQGYGQRNGPPNQRSYPKSQGSHRQQY